MGETIPDRTGPESCQSPVLVGTDLGDGEAKSFVMEKIERMKLCEEEEGEE